MLLPLVKLHGTGEVLNLTVSALKIKFPARDHQGNFDHSRSSLMASCSANPACKHLVLDAGPLLSLSPLRGLAETYYTVPQVLDELKDKRAWEHFERLGLSAGVRIQIQGPDSASLAHGECAVQH